MTRKERENCPKRMKGSGRVLGGEEGAMSTPITEISDGTGPWDLVGNQGREGSPFHH